VPKALAQRTDYYFIAIYQRDWGYLINAKLIFDTAESAWHCLSDLWNETSVAVLDGGRYLGLAAKFGEDPMVYIEPVDFAVLDI
jgi:hypothetical protein